MTHILLVVLAVLLPIVPAYLLFRSLPTTGNISGPFHGTQIKFSGAFAGYLVVMLAVLWQLRGLPTYDVWTVRGQVRLQEGMIDERAIRFTMRPPDVFVSPDGAFRLRLFSAPDQAGDAELPMLVVDYPNHHPVAVDLERRGDRNSLKKSIVLADTLFLRPLPGAIQHLDR